MILALEVLARRISINKYQMRVRQDGMVLEVTGERCPPPSRNIPLSTLHQTSYPLGIVLILCSLRATYAAPRPFPFR